MAPLLVPGVLQTGDYLRAIMTAPGVPPDEVASRVAARLGRREVITRQNPAELLVLLGRAALNQGIGGREVMIGQLTHLLEMAARPNIEIRVIPGEAGWHPGLDGSFALIEKKAPVPRDTIVSVGNRQTVFMLHEPRDVNAFRSAVDQILDVALPSDVSMRFIADLRNRMENSRG